MEPRHAPRIAVVFNGDVTDPRSWSGTPFGVYSGLAAAGAEVVPVNARSPDRAHKALGALLAPGYARRAGGDSIAQRARSAYSAAPIGPVAARAQGASAAKGVRRSLPLDGIVQVGTGFRVPAVAPVVTYEDMTIAQALAYPYRNWRSLSPRDLEARIELQQRCYRAAASVCMTNSWAGSSAIEDYGIDPSIVHSVGVGSHEEPRRVERDLSVPRFLFVGVDWERKNGPRVVRAFRTVRELHPEATLDVVGGHPPLDEPGVTGHGFLRRDDPVGRAELRRLFDAATCFVMPSLFEPSAVVYTEAAACGLPSIGTGVGGSADLIGDAGVLVDPLDDAAIADAMVDLARPERATELAARAALRSEMFTWKAVAERLLRALDPQLLGRELTPFL